MEHTTQNEVQVDKSQQLSTGSAREKGIVAGQKAREMLSTAKTAVAVHGVVAGAKLVNGAKATKDFVAGFVRGLRK